jgi:glycosyltransferase involved in cell wall biosynthesis
LPPAGLGVKLLLIIITFLYFLLLSFFLLGLFFPNQKTIAQKLTASVVIAARNEEKNIGAILNDLVHQTYPTELYEVIIINDGSEDGTGDIVESYSRQYPFVRHISVLVDNQNGLSAKKKCAEPGHSSQSKRAHLDNGCGLSSEIDLAGNNDFLFCSRGGDGSWFFSTG